MSFDIFSNGEKFLANIDLNAIQPYVVDANDEVVGQVHIVHDYKTHLTP